MAKLGKIKFTNLGEYLGNTTSKGDVELTMNYNWLDEYFHFEHDEIKKYFPNYKGDLFSYRQCRTKQNAISVFRSYMKDYMKTERFLRIQIGVSDRVKKRYKSKPLVSGMTGRSSIYGVNTEGLSIEFIKVLRVGETEETYTYTEVDKDWNITNRWSSNYSDNLVSWTQELEDFITHTQNELHRMSDIVLNFFDANDEIDLISRIKNQKLLLNK